MGFRSIFRFCCGCLFPPDHANISEKKAAEAYNAYIHSPSKTDIHSLEASIVHYRDAIQFRPVTDPKYASTKFVLANIHWEAYDVRGASHSHLKEAIALYEETLDVWKDVNPKPDGYFELLRNLGKAYYDLFNTDPGQHTKAILRKATGYYDLAVQYANNTNDTNDNNNMSNCSEINQMLGTITWKGCELEQRDLRLDGAITRLSGAYKFHQSDIAFFNDSSCPHLGSIQSAVDHLTSIIDRKPSSPQIRDLSLLHLCQALLFRYTFKGKSGDPYDLVRAEAVARSAIPLVSPTIEPEFKKLLVLIQHQNDQEGVARHMGSGSANGLPKKRSKTELPDSVATLIMPPREINSPQAIRPPPYTTSTLPIAPLSPSFTSPTTHVRRTPSPVESSIPLNSDGKPHKSSFTQAPRVVPPPRQGQFNPHLQSSQTRDLTFPEGATHRSSNQRPSGAGTTSQTSHL